MAKHDTDVQSFAYPEVPNVDDQIVPRNDVLVDVFGYSNQLIHEELTAKRTSVQLMDREITISEAAITVDGQVCADGVFGDDDLVVIPHDQLVFVTVAVPSVPVMIGKTHGADVKYETSALVYLVPTDKGRFTYTVTLNHHPLYLNGKRTETTTGTIGAGDEIVVDGLLIGFGVAQWKLVGFAARTIDVNTTRLRLAPFKAEYPVDFPEYHRSPRIVLNPPTDSVKLENPAADAEGEKNSLVRTILPPLAMIAASFATTILSQGNPLMSLGMGAASLVTAGMTASAYFTNKKETKAKNVKAHANYEDYLVEKAAELNRLAGAQRKATRYQYPDLNQVAELVMTYNQRLYERITSNSDYLSIALGNGLVSPTFKLEYTADPKDKRKLTSRTVKLANQFNLITDMPIATSLVEQTLGLVGQPEMTNRAVASTWLQLAAFHSYRDVQFVALLPERTYEEDWAKWRWLPHFQLQELNLRGLVHDAQSKDMILNSFYQLINSRKRQLRENGNDQLIFTPQYVLTIVDDSWLNGHQINEFLAEDMAPYGVTVIWAKEDAALLPETVTTYARYDNQDAAELVNEKNEYVAKTYAPMKLPTNYPLADVIRTLANLKHVETEKNAIPTSISFLGLYNVARVEELGVADRWERANTSKSLAVPLGLRGKDDVVVLNLHERAHGPHGLVAGTTGSGKSEALQSYILSLAVNFAPEDVGFLPIDFKGGGMANLFANLPHLLGSITNLDGAASARALASIHAELQKRQRLFGEFGVNHINGYTKLFKQGKTESDPKLKKKYPAEPLPHLFLISDEFAELKANEPDFMAELVSTARIGRSLGVHLILATQKPSGVVDDQIWSNSRFKLALKVQDEADSNEVLKTPDAASIVEPGRAYLQVGNNEIYELFQTAYSGATYDPDAEEVETIDERIWLINNLGQYELLSQDLSDQDEVQSTESKDKVSELAATVDYVARVAKDTAAIIPEKPWLPPLGESLVTPEIDYETEWQTSRKLAVPIGLLDIPTRQAQSPLSFDLAEMGSTAVFASPGYGKTTFLQTLVMNLAKQNSPADLQVNLLDFGTNGLLPLVKLPHVADIVRLDEHEKLGKMLMRISTTLNERRKLFHDVGVATLEQYEQREGALPIIVNVIDGYDAVHDDDNRDEIDATMTQILREGAALGVYLVVTANRSQSIRISMMSTIETKIGLYMVDESDIRDLMGRDALIQQEILGRGQIKLSEGVNAFQTYLPAAGDNAIDRLDNLTAEVDKLNGAWTGVRPPVIPMVPNEFDLQMFNENPEVVAARQQGIMPIGLNLQNTHPYGFNLDRTTYFLMSATDEMQTETQLGVLLDQLQHMKDEMHAEVYLADFDELVTDHSVFDTVYDNSENDGQAIKERLAAAVGRTNAGEYKHEFFVISDLGSFLKYVLISDDDLTLVLKKGYKSGLHLIINAEDEFIGRSFDSAVKAVRNELAEGVTGTRLADSAVLSVNGFSREDFLPGDEAYYFLNHGRSVARIRLPKPSLDG